MGIFTDYQTESWSFLFFLKLNEMGILNLWFWFHKFGLCEHSKFPTWCVHCLNCLSAYFLLLSFERYDKLQSVLIKAKAFQSLNFWFHSLSQNMILLIYLDVDVVFKKIYLVSFRLNNSVSHFPGTRISTFLVFSLIIFISAHPCIFMPSWVAAGKEDVFNVTIATDNDYVLIRKSYFTVLRVLVNIFNKLQL